MAFNDNCLISIMFLLCANIFIVYKTISQDKDNQYYIDETNSKYLSYLFYTKDGVYIGELSTKDFAEHEYKKILERINK